MAIGCASGSDAGDAAVDEYSIVQPAHGPMRNVHVRLVEGPNGDHVLCDGRVRGISGNASLYDVSVRITYPDASSATRNSGVNLNAPLFVDTSDGEFRAELVESPPGSGEYTVKASFKRATSADTGTHQCRVIVDEFTSGPGPMRILYGEGQATSRQTEQPTPYLTATSHRQSGSHMSCRSRLNYANPATDYIVAIQTTTESGSDFRGIDALSSEPLIGPILTPNGGSVVVERGVAPWSSLVPNLDVRFDFVGEVGPSSCLIAVQELTGATDTVLFEESQISVPVCGDLLQGDGGFEGGPFGGLWVQSSTNFGTPICDAISCGTGGGTGPRSGSFWYRGGGTTFAAEIAWVERILLIPDGETLTLSWWMEIPSCEGTGEDFFAVLVNDTPVWNTTDLDPQCGTAGYVLKSVSLDGVFGTNRITLYSETTGTNFMVDDVALIYCL